MRPSFKRTMYACFVGYIVQAIVNNFVPLLFVTFQKKLPDPAVKDHAADHDQLSHQLKNMNFI
mgnify:CR=1 FL=1